MEIIQAKLLGAGVPQQAPEGAQQTGLAPGVSPMSTVVLSSPSERRFIPRNLDFNAFQKHAAISVHPDGAIVASCRKNPTGLRRFSAGTVRNERFGRCGQAGALLGCIPVAEPEMAGAGLTFAMIQWAFLSMDLRQRVHLFLPRVSALSVTGE